MGHDFPAGEPEGGGGVVDEGGAVYCQEGDDAVSDGLDKYSGGW